MFEFDEKNNKIIMQYHIIDKNGGREIGEEEEEGEIIEDPLEIERRNSSNLVVFLKTFSFPPKLIADINDEFGGVMRKIAQLDSIPTKKKLDVKHMKEAIRDVCEQESLPLRPKMDTILLLSDPEKEKWNVISNEMKTHLPDVRCFSAPYVTIWGVWGKDNQVKVEEGESEEERVLRELLLSKVIKTELDMKEDEMNGEELNNGREEEEMNGIEEEMKQEPEEMNQEEIEEKMEKEEMEEEPEEMKKEEKEEEKNKGGIINQQEENMEVEENQHEEEEEDLLRGELLRSYSAKREESLRDELLLRRSSSTPTSTSSSSSNSYMPLPPLSGNIK